MVTTLILKNEGGVVVHRLLCTDLLFATVGLLIAKVFKRG